jgi:hypothetical protein
MVARSSSILPLLVLGIAVTATGLGFSTLAARAADKIEVELDNAKLLKLPPGTETLVIGNPAIADVTVQRNQVMVVTAKNFGSTNMIALDSKGAIVSESRIVVTTPSRPENMVVLRGDKQHSYACTPECGPTVELGDEPGHFSKSMEQARARASSTVGGTR